VRVPEPSRGPWSRGPWVRGSVGGSVDPWISFIFSSGSPRFQLRARTCLRRAGAWPSLDPASLGCPPPSCCRSRPEASLPHPPRPRLSEDHRCLLLCAATSLRARNVGRPGAADAPVCLLPDLEGGFLGCAAVCARATCVWTCTTPRPSVLGNPARGMRLCTSHFGFGIHPHILCFRGWPPCS